MAVDADAATDALGRSECGDDESRCAGADRSEPPEVPPAVESTAPQREPTDNGEHREQCGETAHTVGQDTKPVKDPPGHVHLATVVGTLVVVALATLSGWLGFRAFQIDRVQDQRNQFLQAGTQTAVNLTTIDWQHADADIQRILDGATGAFYDDFATHMKSFGDVVKQAQSKSAGTIAAAGLESATPEGAKMLVAVTVRTSIAGAPEQDPRVWRMRVSVRKVGDHVKVDGVSFVP